MKLYALVNIQQWKFWLVLISISLIHTEFQWWGMWASSGWNSIALPGTISEFIYHPGLSTQHPSSMDPGRYTSSPCVTYSPTPLETASAHSHHNRAERHEAGGEETGPRGMCSARQRPLIEKKTNNNALYSHWSGASNPPLWISPFNINLAGMEQLY